MISRVLEFVRRRNRAQSLRGLPSRYSIVRELGRGGVAVVYLAWDRQLEREVAIKVLHTTNSDDPSTAARLEHEARLVASLQHPHIVSIYDLQRLRNGSVALVMQYVPGRTLRAIIDEKGPLSIPFVDRVLREIAGALALAHRSVIVHRDVKPENIFLEAETDRALLADFGIARGPNLDAGLTLAGEALGTPHYMSPEHITGGELDGRSDLYSLGLVGYEMLTGERPWGGETLYHVLHKQQHESLPPLRTYRADVPPTLKAALDQTLRKRRAERPKNAEVFLSILSGTQVGVVIETESAPDAGSQAGSKPIVEVALNSPTVKYRRPTDSEPRASAGEANPPAPWLLADAAGVTSSQPDPVTREANSRWPRPSPEEVAPGPDLFSPGGAFAVRDDPRFAPDRTASTAGRSIVRISDTARKAVLLVTAAFFIPMTVVILVHDSAPESVAVEDPVATPDSAAETPPDSQPQPPQGSAPRPARGGGGVGGGGGGSRIREDLSAAAREVGEWRYRPAGDITDTFCQPRPSEILTDWSERVPRYCHDRAE